MGLCYLAKISAITIFKELLCSAVTAIQNTKDRCQKYQSRRVEAKALSDISRVETFIIFSQMVSLIEHENTPSPPSPLQYGKQGHLVERKHEKTRAAFILYHLFISLNIFDQM